MRFGQLGAFGLGFGNPVAGVPYPAPEGYVWQPVTITTGDGTVHPVTMTVNSIVHQAYILIGNA